MLRLLPFQGEPESSWHTRLRVRLKDGRSLSRDAPSFTGMPDDPVDLEEIRAKYARLAGGQVLHPLIAELAETA